MLRHPPPLFQTPPPSPFLPNTKYIAFHKFLFISPQIPHARRNLFLSTSKPNKQSNNKTNKHTYLVICVIVSLKKKNTGHGHTHLPLPSRLRVCVCVFVFVLVFVFFVAQLQTNNSRGCRTEKVCLPLAF